MTLSHRPMLRNLLCPLAALSLSGIAAANEALDVLEGRKSASDIALPPASEGSPSATGKRRETIPDPEHQWPPGPLDSFWRRSVLRDTPDDPTLQRLAITGSLEWGGAWGKVQGANDRSLDSTRTRRARLGARLRAFHNTDLEAKFEFAGDSAYQGIERLSARTEIRPDTSITYGKFRPAFTMEYATDEELLPYPDRALLANLLAPARTLGVKVQHRLDDWDLGLGWFSNDANSWFPELEGPGLLVFNLGRSFVEMSGGIPVRARWHLDYSHNFDPGGSTSLPGYDVVGRRSANGNQLVASNPAFRHLLSTGIRLESLRVGFDGDFMFGKGDPTAWGMTLSPSYWAIPHRLKLVGRYHFADSDDAGALIAPIGVASDPYFDDTPFALGNEYHSFYLGANWHIDQNRLVLMGGLEYADLKDDAGSGRDVDAWIWHAGARLSF